MNPDEDPEARIRELERSLNDQARASELGGSQSSSGTSYLPPPVPGYRQPDYSAQPYGGQNYGSQPYGGQPYGTQFPAPGRKSSGGIPWAVFGVIAVVLVAVAAGAAVYTRMAGVTSPDHAKVSGGGGSVGIPSIPSIPNVPSIPNMPSIPGAPAAPGADSDVIAASPDTPASVSGVDNNKTITCTDGAVSISGMRNTVNITGHCVSVTVSGMNNVVTVDTADTIGASGFDNRVTFHSGSPQIDSNGSNVVEQG